MRPCTEKRAKRVFRRVQGDCPAGVRVAACQWQLAGLFRTRCQMYIGTRLATVHSIRWMLVLNRPKRSEDGAEAETSAPHNLRIPYSPQHLPGRRRPWWIHIVRKRISKIHTKKTCCQRLRSPAGRPLRQAFCCQPPGIDAVFGNYTAGWDGKP